MIILSCHKNSEPDTAQTLAIAYEGLMNSPGPRVNILNPALVRAGMGALDEHVELMTSSKCSALIK